MWERSCPASGARLTTQRVMDDPPSVCSAAAVRSRHGPGSTAPPARSSRSSASFSARLTDALVAESVDGACGGVSRGEMSGWGKMSQLPTKP